MAPEPPDPPYSTYALPEGLAGALERFCGLVFEHPQTLVSRTDRQRLPDHAADALTALSLLDAWSTRTVVDLGSGGGFPAVPLAIARPALEVTLLESVGWKARFLAEASTTLGLASRVSALGVRAEEAVELVGRESADLGTARAVAPPIVVAELLAPFVRVGGRLLLWTTASVVATHEPGEVPELGLAAPLAHPAASPLRTDAVLLEWRRVAPVDPRFPRRTGVATKRPLRPAPA